MGFKGVQDHLNVTTLGDVVTELTVMRYQCSLQDVDRKLEFFEAFGMETITGAVSQIGVPRLMKFFPKMSEEHVRKLQRGTKVDFLIGMRHPSWHPERVEKGVGGGNFWVYRGKFGSCVGGCCPGMSEGTKKNQNLFTVNHRSFLISSTVSYHQSHHLEFCSERAASYADSCSTLSLEGPVSSDCGLVAHTKADPAVVPVVVDPEVDVPVVYPVSNVPVVTVSGVNVGEEAIVLDMVPFVVEDTVPDLDVPVVDNASSNVQVLEDACVCASIANVPLVANALSK